MVVTRYAPQIRIPETTASLQPDHKIFFITFCTHQRWKLPPSCRQIVIEVCRRGDGVLFELLAMVVMPDHVHLALCPLSTPDGTFSIPEILQAIKGTSSHRINQQLGRQGRVWQQESFDRALRREEQVEDKILYMLENPVRAGLVGNPLDYPWSWRKTEGWVKIRLQARSGESDVREWGRRLAPGGRGRPPLHRFSLEDGYRLCLSLKGSEMKTK